jgi:D-alanine-D-alanine ligase
MDKIRVGIVYDSGEVSCKSRYDSISDAGVMDEVNAVKSSLEKMGHEVVLVPIGKGMKRFSKPRVVSKLKSELKKAKLDAVFNLCETFCGDARLQTVATAVLERMGIPYSGSPGKAIEVTTDKTRTKTILQKRGVPTPGFRVFSSPKEISSKGLKFPLIIKPNFEDGSVGIEADSVVRTEEQLKRKASQVMRKYSQPALVEEYIEGRELNVAVFINNGASEVLPISEIVFRDFPEGAPKIISYAAKWMESSIEYKNTVGVCPSELPKEVEKKVKSIASRCVKASGCRDYARVDIRLDQDNQPYVIEVNANPDISPKAGFMRSFSASGRTYDDFVKSVLKCTLERKG